MPRQITVDNDTWNVAPAGRVTQYVKDEFALIFTRGTGSDREERVVRYSPRWSLHRDHSLQALSDRSLHELFLRSQPSWTSPETGYRR